VQPTRGALVLRPGDRIVLVPSGAASTSTSNSLAEPPRIPCALPSDLSGLHKGDPIWFDDGKIGGRIRRIDGAEVEVEVTHAKPNGSKLRADRSINLPNSTFDRPPLLPKDIQDLEFVAEHADLVGLSFAESSCGIEQLAHALCERSTRSIGIVLKIETRRGFERLPQLLFAAMRYHPVGVMIARGDLAVECGYERLAEVQEEMLWLCGAAHLPVIWATQVLDQLTRTGRPSRAEITDAAMAERAECVMLNKGPHVVEAVRALSDIMTRMQAHQRKKRSLFRKLHVSEVDGNP
jgi:pyruvate kinase